MQIQVRINSTRTIQRLFSSSSSVTSACSETINLFLPIDSTGLYVAAYANSASNNLTRDWLPVIICASAVGSLNTRDCRIRNISLTSPPNCYTRLDIQIAYTNIGSVFNPQPILSAVIFHYQYQSVVSDRLID